MPKHLRQKRNVLNADKNKSPENLESRLNALKSEKIAETRKKLKNNDCFIGVIPHTQLFELVVTCSKFSVVVQYKSKLISFFVSRKKVFILDPSGMLVKTKVPNSITGFLNSLLGKRKVIIAKVAKVTSSALKICLKFVSALHSGLFFCDLIQLFNLILI